MPAYSASRQKNSSLNPNSTSSRLGFFICNRTADTSTVAFSILASCIGGTATIAMLTLGCNAGWPAFWWLGSGAIGLGLLGLLLAKKVRHTGAASLPEVADIYMGDKCRKLIAIIVILSSIAIVAAQFNAIGILLTTLIHYDFTISVLTGSFITWAYTCIGGQYAVMKSDKWQFLFLTVSLLLFIVFLLRLPQCREAIYFTPLEISNKTVPPARIIYFIFIFGSSFLVGPMLFGRILSAKTQKAAQTATFWSAAGIAAMAILITMTGIAISGLHINSKNPDILIPASLHMVLPEWGILIVILGLLAAVISSADSCLLSAAIVYTNDIRPGGVRETRIAMTVIAIISCCIVFTGKSILDLLLAASDIYTCGVVGPVFVTMLANVKSESDIFAIPVICGGICGLFSAISGNSNWSFTGLGISAGIVLMLLLYHKISLPRQSR